MAGVSGKAEESAMSFSSGSKSALDMKGGGDDVDSTLHKFVDAEDHAADEFGGANPVGDARAW